MRLHNQLTPLLGNERPDTILKKARFVEWLESHIQELSAKPASENGAIPAESVIFDRFILNHVCYTLDSYRNYIHGRNSELYVYPLPSTLTIDHLANELGTALACKAQWHVSGGASIGKKGMQIIAELLRRLNFDESNSVLLRELPKSRRQKKRNAD